jgi:hypothetical protein
MQKDDAQLVASNIPVVVATVDCSRSSPVITKPCNKADQVLGWGEQYLLKNESSR